jgi:hypothetical protein
VLLLPSQDMQTDINPEARRSEDSRWARNNDIWIRLRLLSSVLGRNWPDRLTRVERCRTEREIRPSAGVQLREIHSYPALSFAESFARKSLPASPISQTTLSVAVFLSLVSDGV